MVFHTSKEKGELEADFDVLSVGREVIDWIVESARQFDVSFIDIASFSSSTHESEW